MRVNDISTNVMHLREMRLGSHTTVLLSIRSWRCILRERRVSPWPDVALEID